jgi:hypothetical protein
MEEGLVHQTMAFPAHDQAAEIPEPGEGAFDVSTTILSSRHFL